MDAKYIVYIQYVYTVYITYWCVVCVCEADRITEREAFIHSQNKNTILKSKGKRRKGGNK